MPEPTITIAETPGSNHLYAVRDPDGEALLQTGNVHLAVRMAHQRARTMQTAVTYSSGVVTALATDEFDELPV